MIVTVSRYGLHIDGKSLLKYGIFSKYMRIIEFLFLSPGWVTKDQIMDWIYPIDDDCDAAQPEILEKFIWEARQLLKPYGIQIENNYGTYRINNKPRVVIKRG